MRYLVIVLSVLFIMISCNNGTHEMVLTGNVKGLKRGIILLHRWDDSLMKTIDSVIIEGQSNFKIKQQLNEPEVLYLTIRLKDGVFMDDEIAFFAEPKTININTKLEQFGSSARVTGSVNDSLWRVYNKIKQRYIDKNLELVQKKLTLTSEKRDSTLQVIEREEQSLANSKYMTTVNFALNHQAYEIAPYLMINEAYQLRSKFLDTVYQALHPEIKESKYGQALEQLYQERIEEEKSIL